MAHQGSQCCRRHEWDEDPDPPQVDSNTAAVWVQGVYLSSSLPPRVLVAKEPPRNPGAVSQSAVAAFYANEPSYRALIDGVCREYGAAHCVDLRPGWDNTTMVSDKDTSYRFHPNTLAGLPQFVGRFGISGGYLAWSGACGGR